MCLVTKTWKESLSRDGQQFHQFINKMNKYLTPKIIEYKRHHIMVLEILVLARDLHK